MSNSSTSSSDSLAGVQSPGRGIPWAAMLAVLVLVTLEQVAYSQRPLWMWLTRQDPFGIAEAHLALMDLEATTSGKPRVIVVGPSRVQSGFTLLDARRDRPEIAWAKVTHPRFDAFTIRSMTSDLLAAKPAAVVFLWSELDTNRPLRLEPIPGSTVVSLPAIGELLKWAGPGFAIEHRTSLYRLLATRFEQTYRYRPAFQDAGLESLADFRLDDRLQPQAEARPHLGQVAVWDAEPNQVSRKWRERMVKRFPPRTRGYFEVSVDRVAEVTPGKHADLMRMFIRRTVEILRAADVEAILIEAPLHPAAGQIYDASLRSRFLRFARRLERDHGVHFVPLEAMPRFSPSDFADMLHLHEGGSAEMTQVIERAVEAALYQAGPSS